jgi:hypothetical protein
MITEATIKTFQKNNKQLDIMGVVRTLYPGVHITLPTKGKKK